jgi:hypothetical protein
MQAVETEGLAVGIPRPRGGGPQATGERDREGAAAKRATRRDRGADG